MDEDLPDWVKELQPDPTIRETVRACGRHGGVAPVHSNVVLETLSSMYRKLVPRGLTLQHANVIAHVIAERLYASSPDSHRSRAHALEPKSYKRLVSDWWEFDDRPTSRDPKLAEHVGIRWILMFMRDYDEDANVVRGAAYALERLDELRSLHDSPGDPRAPRME